MTKVTFVGVGTMGGPIARRVLDAGHELVVTDRHRPAAEALEAAGAVWSDDLVAAVAGAEVVMLSLPGPREVEDVVAGERGLLGVLAPGTVIVDLSTNSLETVRRLADRCAAKGIGFVDAPVSGGKAGAAAGTLAVMVGGADADVARVQTVLESFGDPVIHFGPSGTGTTVKLVNNQVFLCGEIVFQEGLVLAAKAGIDPAQLVALLERTGAGGAHVRNGARVIGRQFVGPGFALALAEKDVALALAAGRELSVPMPASAQAHQVFVEALGAGLAESRSFATLQMVERAAAFEVPVVERDDADG